MYSIGDYVVKSTDGVCRIEDVLHPDLPVADPDTLYYLLKPLDNSRSTLYVAIDMATTQGVRPVMSKEAAADVLAKFSELDTEWIKNDREREEAFKKIIKSYDPIKMAGMIKSLHMKKAERYNAGKKNTSTEERFLNNAENLLYSELAFVLESDKNEVMNMVKGSIGAE